MIVRLLVVIYITICLLLMLTGCWGQREVNDLAIITAYGLDASEDNKGIELSVQIIVPQKMNGGGQNESSGGNEAKTIVRSAQGLSVPAALNALEHKVSRQLFWGQADVLIIGEELARTGIDGHLDFLVREDEMRLSILTFVCQGKAKKLLASSSDLDPSSADALEQETKFLFNRHFTLNKFLQGLSSESKAVLAPWVVPPSTEESVPTIDGRAIIKKGRLVGRVDKKVSKGILFIQDQIYPMYITVNLKDGFAAVGLLNSRTKLIPRIENGQWRIIIQVETMDDIVQNMTHLDLANPKASNQVKKALEEEIKTNIDMALKQVQNEMKADVFGFGKAFHRRYPDEWKKNKGRWEKIFPELEVTVEVTANVQRPGLNNAPSGLPQEEMNK